jgi:hypothetical protein
VSESENHPNRFPIDPFFLSDVPAEFTPNCNVFDFMVGFIYYSSTPELSLAALLDLALTHSSPFQLDNAAYDALFIASQYGGVTDQKIRQNAYQFCSNGVTNLTCSLVVFNFFDPEIATVTETYYQLFDGACHDSFTIPEAKW